jgi:hypothetical protein
MAMATPAANPENVRQDIPAKPFWVSRSALSAQIPLEQFPSAYRDSVRKVLEKPTLSVKGPVEVFRGQTSFYHWLLDHPDQGVLLWRRLGAKCMDIADLGNGRFGWSDDQGTQFQWETVFRNEHQRVWFASGSSLAPFPFTHISARAVVVLRYGTVLDGAGRPMIHQQADLYLQVDSKAVSFFTHLLGISGPQLAEKCLSQMQMFFSALVWYSDRHPELAEDFVEKVKK